MRRELAWWKPVVLVGVLVSGLGTAGASAVIEDDSDVIESEKHGPRTVATMAVTSPAVGLAFGQVLTFRLTCGGPPTGPPATRLLHPGLGGEQRKALLGEL